MKYICENDHVFEHVAKLTLSPTTATGSLEVPVCPICETRIYAEYVLGTTISSVISVDLAEVDSKLREGYVVESLYAKTATLVKKD